MLFSPPPRPRPAQADSAAATARVRRRNAPRAARPCVHTLTFVTEKKVLCAPARIVYGYTHDNAGFKCFVCRAALLRRPTQTTAIASAALNVLTQYVQYTRRHSSYCNPCYNIRAVAELWSLRASGARTCGRVLRCRLPAVASVASTPAGSQ